MKIGADSNIFKNKPIAMMLAVSCSVAWAFAFPLVKLGMSEFRIPQDDTGTKTLFAGVRFLLAGIAVLIIAKLMGRKVKPTGVQNWLIVLLFAVVNTSLKYFFYYIGLSYQSGSRSAIIDSMSTFILIVLACIFFKDEKMTLKKILGCLLGFGGIMLVNIGGSDLTSKFTLQGDGMLIMSAVASAFGGLLTRVATRKTDPLAATGIGLAVGGGVMSAAGLLMGGRLNTFSGKGIVIFICLVAISVYGFSIYNQLICYNPVAEIAIFNSLIPILGVILSCAILGEPFEVRYIVAGITVALGVCVINSKVSGKVKQRKTERLTIKSQ